jgi:hypothetical protein
VVSEPENWAEAPNRLLQALEERSPRHPDRVLRLRGEIPGAEAGSREPCELLIFRGFASSISHPTAFDPDQPLLPVGAQLHEAELLLGPFDPAAERRLAGPASPLTYLVDQAWLAGT